MKKAFVIFALILLAFTLCGCEKEAITPDKQKYIVASLGFDNERGKLKMYMESIVVNSEQPQEKEKLLLLSGTGNTSEEAYDKISSGVTQPIMLSHISVIIIGKGLTKGQFSEIMEFCTRKNEINPAAMVISAEKAEDILVCKPVSSIAVGYDLMSMVDVVSKNNGIVFRNKFYQVQSSKKKPMNMFYVPYVSVNKDGFYLYGLQVYRSDLPVRLFDMEGTKCFCFLTDNCRSGDFVFDGTKTDIRSIRTKYNLGYSGNLFIELTVNIKGSCDEKKLEENMRRLFYSERDNFGDVFGFYNLLYKKEPEIWEELKTDYASYFKNATVKVTVNEQKGVF